MMAVTVCSSPGLKMRKRCYNPSGNDVLKILNRWLSRKLKRIFCEFTVLNAGQQLIVLKCSKFYGSAAYFELQQSIGVKSFNFIGIARSQFHGFAGVKMVDFSGTPEQWMSGGLTSAKKRQKKSSNLAASPPKSVKSEALIGCRTPGMISLFAINEAGKNIAEHSERTQGGHRPPNPQPRGTKPQFRSPQHP